MLLLCTRTVADLRVKGADAQTTISVVVSLAACLDVNTNKLFVGKIKVDLRRLPDHQG